MKLLTLILALSVSSVAYAGVGDKYMCDVMKRPLIEPDLVDDGNTEDWAFEVKFSLYWVTETKAVVKRIDLLDKPVVFMTWELEIDSYVGDEVQPGFIGREQSALGDVYASFNTGHGRLLFVYSWGTMTNPFSENMSGQRDDKFYVYVWHMNCINV